MIKMFVQAPVSYVTQAKAEKYKASSEFIPAQQYPRSDGCIPIDGEIGMLATKSKYTRGLKAIRQRIIVKG